MSKMSEIDGFISELRNAVQTVKSIADSLEEMFGENKPDITLEQVRAVLTEKSRAGFTAEVRSLLLKHGAEKLSDIEPDKYSALLTEAEVIGNG